MTMSEKSSNAVASSASTAPQKRKRLSAADRRAAILQGAQELIRDQGTERLTMDGLAAYCGINKALPYSHFKNKDDVIVALYNQLNGEIDQLVTQAIENLEGFEQRIAGVVHTWIDFMESGRDVPSLQQARTASGELEQVREERLNAIAQFIASEIVAGTAMPMDKAFTVAAILIAGTQGLVHVYENTNISARELADTYIEMALGSIKAMNNKA